MRVALFASCLVDLFRPNAGFATVSLLENAGCIVDVPPEQTCCGQPAYNNGDKDNARDIAKQVINEFSDYEYIIVPSSSCAGMMIKHYPQLFEDNAEWYKKATDFSAHCYDLVTFLHDILKITSVPVTYQGNITYHDSCSSLRETRVKDKTRHLLACNEKINLLELGNPEACCGFGGTFCVKYPEISESMVNDKIADIEATGADTVVSGDMGCLLNIAGRLKRLNKPIKVFHIAEVLAGMTGIAAIGDADDTKKSEPSS
ncbi:MAG: (Fe-S)-binding protein [Gammaproteobacteria bacterium]|nr:(Fe-S)-binding protein [Gammaproteobacteria bacterium]